MGEYGAMVEWYWQGKTEVLREKYYTAWVVDEWMRMEQWWNDTDRDHWSTWKNLVQFPLCPQKHHRTGLGSNMSLRCERPTTNHPSDDMASFSQSKYEDNHHYALLTIAIVAFFLLVKWVRGIQLMKQIHEGPRLRMNGCVPPLPLNTCTFRACIWTTLLLGEFFSKTQGYDFRQLT